MSLLNEYIEKIKKETKGLSELETVRYIYLDLGQKFHFDLEYAFGNKKTRKDIYSKSTTNSQLDKSLETNITICKTLSRIILEVLNSIKIDSTIEMTRGYSSEPSHVYNVINQKDGKTYRIDLQADLENIQAHCRTFFFGKSDDFDSKDIISRDELEIIDRKLGYIKEDYYYADEYIDLIKSITTGMTDLKEKVEVAILNIEPYDNPNIKYAERKWHHERLIKKIFSAKETTSIEIIDCYKETEKGKEYQTCIVVNKGAIPDIYLFSNTKCRYEKISMEEISKLISEGLIPMTPIPRYKNWLNMKKRENNESYLI